MPVLRHTGGLLDRFLLVRWHGPRSFDPGIRFFAPSVHAVAPWIPFRPAWSVPLLAMHDSDKTRRSRNEEHSKSYWAHAILARQTAGHATPRRPSEQSQPEVRLLLWLSPCLGRMSEERPGFLGASMPCRRAHRPFNETLNHGAAGTRLARPWIPRQPALAQH